MPKAPKDDVRVHIHDERFLTRALCGTPWSSVEQGGRVASDTDPPVIVDETGEKGSAKAATCVTCLAVWRRRRLKA